MLVKGAPVIKFQHDPNWHNSCSSLSLPGHIELICLYVVQIFMISNNGNPKQIRDNGQTDNVMLNLKSHKELIVVRSVYFRFLPNDHVTQCWH